MRLWILVAGVAAVVVAFIAISSNDRDSSPQPAQSGRQAAPAGTPVNTDPKPITVTAEDLGQGWKMDREGAFVTLQFSRSFDPVQDGGRTDRMTVAVSAHANTGEAKDAFNSQFGSPEAAELVIRPPLTARPIEQSTIQISEITDRLPKLGAEKERVFCADFATPGGKRYAEITGLMQVTNMTARYTAFGAAPQGCRGELPMLADAANLAQAQFQKLHTQK
jgi:hypothetical protein